MRHALGTVSRRIGRTAFPATLALALLFGLGTASTAASQRGGPQLTGAFSFVLTTIAPRSQRGQHFDVAWSFTPACDTGACNVELDTVANACPTGSCPQPLSVFVFDGKNLTLKSGHYLGSFAILAGCYAQSVYWPYGYTEHASLNLVPAATEVMGSIGNQPLRQVSVLSGTLSIAGSASDSSYRARGCVPYAFRYSVHGVTES